MVTNKYKLMYVSNGQEKEQIFLSIQDLNKNIHNLNKAGFDCYSSQISCSKLGEIEGSGTYHKAY